MSSGRYNLGTLQELSDSGILQPGYKVRFKISGTDILQDTYQDPGLTVPNLNPIVADMFGRITVNVFITDKNGYRAEILRPDDTVIDFFDPLYKERVIIEAASFPANPWPDMEVVLTTDNHRYRRNRANTAWIDLGPYDSIGSVASVSDVVAGTAPTLIVTPDALAGLWEKGPNIVAAASLVIPPEEGGYFVVTGNTAISGISAAHDGRYLRFRFTGTPTLTDGANFDLGTFGNIPVQAGDMAGFTRDGTAWYLTHYWRANGEPMSVNSLVATIPEMEAGTDNTALVTAANAHRHASATKVWGEFDGTGTVAILLAFNVTSFLDNGVGDYTVVHNVDFSSSSYGYATGTSLPGLQAGITWRVNTSGVLPTAAAWRGVNSAGDDETVTDVDFLGAAFWGDQV